VKDFLLDWITPVAVAAFAAGVAVLVYFTFTTSGTRCPPGQVLAQTGSVPVMTGHQVVIVPLFGCTPG
jgi:hypothetical protein